MSEQKEMAGGPRLGLRLRGVLSALAGLAFIVMFASGGVLFLAPGGRLARQTDWSFLGFDRWQWLDLHITFALAFTVVGVFHLAFNWRPFLSYLRRRRRGRAKIAPEGIVALVVALGLIALVALNLPPTPWVESVRGYFHSAFWR